MRSNDEKAQTIDFNRAKIVATHSELSGSNADSHELLARLTRRLQTTLDSHKLIEIFAEEMRQMVDFQQFTFQDEEHTYKIGKRAGVHSCQFNLKLDSIELGSLTLSRKARFSEEELNIVERLAGTLVFPLNNARMYHIALQSALRDELTGLGNKRALQADIHREAERAVRHGTPLSVIVLDVDHFKRVNDTYGHVAGDQVLKTLANTLKASARKSDLCYRNGGEEFLVILDNSTVEQTQVIAERFRSSIEQQNFFFGTEKIPVTASLGFASFHPGETLESFINRADKALYAAKESGRNRYCNGERLAEQNRTENKENLVQSA